MTMNSTQAGILQGLPRVARYLSFSLNDASAVRAALMRLVDLVDGDTVVVGLGPPTVAALGVSVPGLRPFPDLSATVNVPSTPVALWCWLRSAADTDQGHLLHVARRIEQAVVPAFKLDDVTDAFSHAAGRDLSGYEDGTENPEEPAPVALVSGAGAGLDGGSLVAVQKWVHDLEAIANMAQHTKDHTIGRRQSDNEELDDAPDSAHVKRTAQESFTPEAFVWRRSMPWAAGQQGGLMFVAFGHTLDAFEAQMRRMAGLEDGTVDALFTVSQPVSGAYLWCPPVKAGRLDLSALKID